MKTDKTGLAGPVTVIGLVYLLAMAAAPGTGLSAQAGPSPTDPVAHPETHPAFDQTGVRVSRVEGTLEPGGPMAQARSFRVVRTCPVTSGARMAEAEWFRVHHRLPHRPSGTPGVTLPVWGKAKITVF